MGVDVARDGAARPVRVPLDGWRPVLATGADAREFLHNLLTADVASLREGEASRALLLTPTGRIRADVTVAALDLGFLLVQSPDQPTSIGDLLTPYLLSADAALQDRSGDLAVVALPGADAPPRTARRWYAPSAIGPGIDLVLEPGDPPPDLPEEAWTVTEADRIAAGRARFPVDLTGRSLPNEAGLERLIDVEKGCFLGQEAVAKVRTLGHPTHVVLSVEADGLLEAGEEVLADGEPAGVVTGAAAGDEGRAAGIVRVRWAARDGHLETERGTALAVRGLARGPA